MVATTPRPDDCVSGWALNEADRKLAASTSPSDPNRHRATSGSLKVRIETRWRTTCGTTKTEQQERLKRLGKKNRKPLDVNDLLIETRLCRQFGLTFPDDQVRSFEHRIVKPLRQMETN